MSTRHDLTGGVVNSLVGALRGCVDAVLEVMNSLNKVGQRLRKHKIQWDQIMEMERDRLEVWDDYYFSYYVFDANLALGLVVLLIFQLCSILHVARSCWIGFVVMMLVLALDAFGLRCEIKGILDATQRHPKNRRRQSASAVGQTEHSAAAEIEQDEG